MRCFPISYELQQFLSAFPFLHSYYPIYPPLHSFTFVDSFLPLIVTYMFLYTYTLLLTTGEVHLIVLSLFLWKGITSKVFYVLIHSSFLRRIIFWSLWLLVLVISYLLYDCRISSASLSELVLPRISSQVSALGTLYLHDSTIFAKITICSVKNIIQFNLKGHTTIFSTGKKGTEKWDNRNFI